MNTRRLFSGHLLKRVLSVFLCFSLFFTSFCVFPREVSADSDYSGYYYIRDYTTGKYLTVYDGEDCDFSSVGIYPYDGSSAQRWFVSYCDDCGYYHLYPDCSYEGRCLDVTGGEMDIYLSSGCYGYCSFDLYSGGDGSFLIRNEDGWVYAGGTCDDCWDSAIADPDNADIWEFISVWQTDSGYEDDYDYDYDYDDDSSSYYNADELSGIYYIRDTYTGKYLTVNRGEDYNFNPVGIYPYCGTESQQFYVYYCDDCGYYHLCPESSAEGRRLDITGGQLDIYLCYGCPDYCCFNIYDDGCGAYEIENSEGYLYADSCCDDSWDYVYTSTDCADRWEFVPVWQTDSGYEDDYDDSDPYYYDGELSGIYYIRDTYTGKYLTVNRGEDYNFNPVGIYPYCGTTSQKFDVHYCTDCGYYHLCPESSAERRRLDITGGQLDIYLCYGCPDYCCFNIYDDGCGAYEIENSEGYLYADSCCDDSWDYVYTSTDCADRWEFIPVDQPEQSIESDSDVSTFYNVTFYVDGEIYDVLEIEEYYTLDESDLPDLEDMWYEGWYFADSDDPFDSRDITEDVDLYARFPEEVPVTLYYPLGGVYESDTIYVPFGECLNEDDIPVFVDEGYVADGWYLEDDYYEDAFDFSCPLTEPTALFLKSIPEELLVVLYYVNGSVYSTDSVEKGSELDLPQEIDSQNVCWYTDKSCTSPYLGGEVHENMSLYTRVNQEHNFYIVDAETYEAVAFDSYDLRRLSHVYISSAFNDNYDSNRYKVKWHITSLGGSKYSIQLAEEGYTWLYLCEGNPGLDMTCCKTEIVDIIENDYDDDAPEGQFNPDYRYEINGEYYYIISCPLAEPTERFPKSNPTELYVVLYYVNNSFYSMDFVEEGDELELPQEVDSQIVSWYKNETCTRPYSGGEVHESMSLYTRVTHEHDFYIIDAETYKAVAFDSYDLRRLSNVYVSSAFDEDYDSDQYKVKWNITSLGDSKYSIHLAEGEVHTGLYLYEENPGLEMTNDTTEIVDIIENDYDDNAPEGQFNPEYRYEIADKYYYIVNVDETDSFQRPDEEYRLSQLIDELYTSSESSWDTIWNYYGYSEKEKDLLLNFGGYNEYNSDAQNVWATYNKLKDLADGIDTDVQDVIEAQLWVARNDYNWYYITSFVEDTEPESELTEQLAYMVIKEVVSKTPPGQLIFALCDLYKAFDEAEAAYASCLDRSEAAIAAGIPLINYFTEALFNIASTYIGYSITNNISDTTGIVVNSSSNVAEDIVEEIDKLNDVLCQNTSWDDFADDIGDSGFRNWLTMGDHNNSVYLGNEIDVDYPCYIGITKQPLSTRLAQHQRAYEQTGHYFYQLDAVTQNMTRNQARAVEQYFIENMVENSNVINSISPKSEYYDDAMAWAKRIVESYGLDTLQCLR